MTARERCESVRDFASGVASVMLVTYGSGGTGINCQRANVVLLLDLRENPADEAQAVGRAWRTGQTRSVTVLRLAAQRTLEMRILRRSAMKTAMARVMLEGGMSRLRDGGRDAQPASTSHPRTPRLLRTHVPHCAGWLQCESL